MSIRDVPETVVEKLKNLPKSPGCYIYTDEKGEVLYVGKALVLRNRVRSYFQTSTKHGIRIERMVNKIRDIEWIVVDSELEALVLECNLIKQHRPRYNVRLRDDKSYPYITITKEAFPRLLFTRQLRKDGAQYFGPYSSSYAVRDMLQLLHKVFPLIPCGKSWSGRNEQRPCLYYHLGRCLAPCAGLAKKDEYGKVIEQVSHVLRGREDTLVSSLKVDMLAASEALDFEKAAYIRDQLNAIDHTLQRQKVLSSDRVDQDVIAVVKDDRGAAIQMLYIRNGKLIGQHQYMLDGATDAPPGVAVQEFVKQYYASAPEVPREILLPVEIEEINIVQAWLRQKKGSAVTIEVPAGGEKLRMVEMAANNAEFALAAFRQEIEVNDIWAADAMQQLQDELQLPTLPMRVEGYDISNISGTAPVGSMVVTENGSSAKAEYRRFKIKFLQETPNDFAMMNEVIMRRLRNYLDGNEKFMNLPDLIMIDGGKGQLGAALKARDDLGLTMPMIGLAKKQEIIFMPTHQNLDGSYSYREVVLPMTDPGLMLLRKLRDEAHRFALTFHRKIRDKRLNGSVLDEVPGVGPRRRRMLLRTFGSIEAIRRASAEDIASVPTMTKQLAAKVKEYLTDV